MKSTETFLGTCGILWLSLFAFAGAGSVPQRGGTRCNVETSLVHATCRDQESIRGSVQSLGAIVQGLRSDKAIRSLLSRDPGWVTECTAKLHAAVRGDSSEVRALCEVIGVICAPVCLTGYDESNSVRPLWNSFKQHKVWHRLLGRAATRVGSPNCRDTQAVSSVPALELAYALSLHGYVDDALLDRLYNAEWPTSLTGEELYKLSTALANHCTNAGSGEDKPWRKTEFKQHIAMQMLCRLHELKNVQQVAEASVAIVSLAAAEREELVPGTTEGTGSEAEKFRALVRAAAGLPSSTADSHPPLDAPQPRPRPAAAPRSNELSDEWVPAAQRRASAGGYTLYSMEEEEGVKCDKDKLAAMVEAAASGQSLETVTALKSQKPLTTCSTQVSLTLNQIQSLDKPLLFKFHQAVHSLPAGVFDEETMDSLDEVARRATQAEPSSSAALAAGEYMRDRGEPSAAMVRLREAVDTLQASSARGSYVASLVGSCEETLRLINEDDPAESEAHYLCGLLEGLLAEYKQHL
jgi:hypothetical protein